LGIGPANRLRAEIVSTDVIGGNGNPYFSYGSRATTDVYGVTTLGTLKASVRADVSASVFPYSITRGVGAFGDAGGDVQLGWGDTIIVTSSTRSIGELVPFEVSFSLDRLVSASGKYVGSSQAYASGGFQVDAYGGSLGIFDSNYSPSNTTQKTATVYLPVGIEIPIQGYLDVSALARSQASLPDRVLDEDLSIADASNTAHYYLTPLMNDVSYTSSGTTYFYSAAATSVPEPFTIVGTLIGGTAALRMRRKLKSDPNV
jgi:hypothetical protein